MNLTFVIWNISLPLHLKCFYRKIIPLFELRNVVKTQEIFLNWLLRNTKLSVTQILHHINSSSVGYFPSNLLQKLATQEESIVLPRLLHCRKMRFVTSEILSVYSANLDKSSIWLYASLLINCSKNRDYRH